MELHSTIDISGLRSLEYIGQSDKAQQSKNCLLQVKFEDGNFFQPYKPYIKNNLNFDNLIRDTLNFGFFENLSLTERLNWINQNSTDVDTYLSDLKCEIRFLKIGGKFLELSTIDQNKCMSGEWLPIEEVYQMFPRKTNSKAFRHTLIFRGGNWKLVNFTPEIKCDLYLSLIDGSLSNLKPTNFQIYPVNYKNITLGIYDEIACHQQDFLENINSFVADKISWFSPSIHKSLIQKCIRVCSQNVKFLNILVPTEDVLITSFLMLIFHPGCFVPNIQTFVSGAESACKRLAISILEDSSSDLNSIYLLFSASLAARNGWKPSIQFLNKCIILIRKVLTPKYFIYDWHSVDKNKVLDNSFSQNSMIIGLLQTLKSFESDILMTISIVQNNGETKEFIGELPKIMNIEHCLDHHSITEIAHFYISYKKQTPAEIFKIIWEKCTGINSRKQPFFPNYEVQSAQHRLWLAKTLKKQKNCNSFEECKIKRNIDIGWISGIIGPIKNKIDSLNVLSFFHPENLSEIITIREPSRDNTCELSTEIKQKASLLVETQKNEWFEVSEPLLDIKMFFCFRMGEFYCYSDGTVITWSEYCKSDYLIKVYNNPEIIDFDELIKNVYSLESDGVSSNYLLIIENILKLELSEVILRLAMYIRPFNREIEIYKISRDGSGTYLSVEWTDCYVFRFLLKLCQILPGVIFTNSSLKFYIKNFIIWGQIRELIFSMIIHQPSKWDTVFNDPRTLRVHQIEAVELIMDRISEVKRGNLIWMDVGQGKTLIVTTVIGNLISANLMPKYCIYSLPPSAIESVRLEIKSGNLKVNLIDATKKNEIEVLPFCINLIKHDHLRMLKEKLVELAPEMFVIIDEFHLLLDNTKRTSVGLELVKLSYDFIGMTGTLIKDKDENKIIQWLNTITSFEITPKNYMIGIATLVSRKMNLGIEEIRNFINVDMTDSRYYQMVDSRFGGTGERTHFLEAVEICYEVIYNKMVELILQKINEGVLFVVVKDIKMQQRLAEDLDKYKIKSFLISNQNSIVLTPNSKTDIRVVITTTRHSSGYTLTICSRMITSIYFSNEATRSQLVGRILRFGQKEKSVNIDILHTGILSYTLQNYEKTRSIVKALGDLAKVV